MYLAGRGLCHFDWYLDCWKNQIRKYSKRIETKKCLSRYCKIIRLPWSQHASYQHLAAASATGFLPMCKPEAYNQYRFNTDSIKIQYIHATLSVLQDECFLKLCLVLFGSAHVCAAVVYTCELSKECQALEFDPPRCRSALRWHSIAQTRTRGEHGMNMNNIE